MAAALDTENKEQARQDHGGSDQEHTQAKKQLSEVRALAAGFAAFGLVRALSSVIIIYGRRRTILMILAGYLMGMIARYFVGAQSEEAAIQYSVIGFIVPGLIAIWLDRRGIVESLCSLITASVVVRLVLILIFGAELNV